jgi:hypothetical protein
MKSHDWITEEVHAILYPIYLAYTLNGVRQYPYRHTQELQCTHKILVKNPSNDLPSTSFTGITLRRKYFRDSAVSSREDYDCRCCAKRNLGIVDAFRVM